jgi:hypothetical protein
LKIAVWTAALCLGLAIGLTYAWVVSPVRVTDITPGTLRSDFKDDFRAAIASAYAATGNLDRARARLALLNDPDPIVELAAQAQRALAGGASFETAQELALLGSDLGKGSSSVILPTSTGLPARIPTRAPGTAISSEVVTPAPPAGTESAPLAVTASPTMRPTRTLVPTATAPFVLLSKESNCDPIAPPGLLEVTVLDARGHSMPGVELALTWSGGEDRFFTGFKTEVNNGYADYAMAPGVSYSLVVGSVGPPTSGLVAPSCPDANGKTFAGGLALRFQQP